MLSAKYPGFDEDPLDGEEADSVSTRVPPKRKRRPGGRRYWVNVELLQLTILPPLSSQYWVGARKIPPPPPLMTATESLIYNTFPPLNHKKLSFID
jgi:hypothetical protein